MYNTKILTDNGVNLEKSLELFGDMDTYNETLVDFLNDVERKLHDIKKYKELSDMANYAILVHSLKSDAKYFGFERLAELAYNHELRSKANDMYYVADNYKELMEEANRIVKLVKSYLGVATEKDIKKETTHSDNTEKNKILVVDDSNIISNFITKIFDDTYDVISLKDGKEAIDFLANNTSTIRGMLLDLNMPNVNGYEVLNFMKINNFFSKISVAIITGTDSASVLQNTKGYPIVAILEKPFNEANVRKVVNMLVK